MGAGGEPEGAYEPAGYVMRKNAPPGAVASVTRAILLEPNWMPVLPEGAKALNHSANQFALVKLQDQSGTCARAPPVVKTRRMANVKPKNGRGFRMILKL